MGVSPLLLSYTYIGNLGGYFVSRKMDVRQGFALASLLDFGFSSKYALPDRSKTLAIEGINRCSYLALHKNLTELMATVAISSLKKWGLLA
jgi:hypothetical protein